MIGLLCTLTYLVSRQASLPDGPQINCRSCKKEGRTIDLGILCGGLEPFQDTLAPSFHSHALRHQTREHNCTSGPFKELHIQIILNETFPKHDPHERGHCTLLGHHGLTGIVTVDRRQEI